VVTTSSSTGAAVNNTNPFGPVAVYVTNADFCTMCNNRNAMVSFGQTIVSSDSYSELTVNFNLNNPHVSGSPNAAGCYSAFKTLVCTKSFMQPGNVGECKATCTTALELCGILASEATYLDCIGTSNNDRDTSGECGSITFDAATDTLFGKPAIPYQYSGAFARLSLSLPLLAFVSLVAMVVA